MARDPVVPIPTQQKTFLRKGKWLPEEDQKLVAYISKYRIWNWNEMPKYAGLWRSGKSCRLRWMNYLQPGIKHGNITEEEEEIIIKWHKVLGNRWSAIAKKLPQRTDCEIKNYWNTHLRKLVQATTTTNSTSEAENHSSDASNHLEENHSNIQMQAPIGVVDDDPLVSSSTHESDSPFRIDDSYEAFQEILRSWEREIRRPMDTVSTFKH